MTAARPDPQEAGPDDAEPMPTIGRLDELVELVGREPHLYVRWSRGPAADRGSPSVDHLTGVPMSGLSANPLAVEDWWGERPLRVWVARRLYDYRHLPERRGPGVRPWVLAGREVGRGPDNEPLVTCDRPVAWLAGEVVDEATAVIDEQPADWGTLDRG